MKTITIVPTSRGYGCIINVRPPPDWKEISFKRLSRKDYYEEQLQWSDEDGEVEQDEWLDCVCEIINRKRDTVYVNNNRKLAILEFFGFKRCINKQAYPNLEWISKEEEKETCTHV